MEVQLQIQIVEQATQKAIDALCSISYNRKELRPGGVLAGGYDGI